jgi:pilus assembly protein CpaB
MKNRRRVLGIGFALLLAAGGTAALVGYVNKTTDAAVANEAQVEVYKVTKPVAKGADADTIKAAIALEKIPQRVKPDGAVTDTSTIGTNVAAVDLQPGEVLLTSRLVPKAQVSLDIPADKVQISATLEPERAVGGVLKQGDTVGVYLSFDPFDLDQAGQATTPDTNTANGAQPAQPKKSPNTTHLEFQHVLVTNVQISDEQTKNVDGKEQATLTTSTHYIVTLALSPAESERFVFASEFGHIWLSNEPATVKDDDTGLVTLGDVYTVVK